MQLDNIFSHIDFLGDIIRELLALLWGTSTSGGVWDLPIELIMTPIPTPILVDLDAAQQKKDLRYEYGSCDDCRPEALLVTFCRLDDMGRLDNVPAGFVYLLTLLPGLVDVERYSKCHG